MQDIFGVHHCEGKCDLVEAPPDEVLAQFKAIGAGLDHTSHGTTFHQLENHRNTSLEVVNFLTAYYLCAIEVIEQATLIDHVLALLNILWLSEFQREKFLVRVANDFKDLAECAFANLP